MSDSQFAPIWNDSNRTFTGLKVSVTDTASDANSKVLDLLVNDVSKFSVQKDGLINLNGYLLPNNYYSIAMSW